MFPLFRVENLVTAQMLIAIVNYEVAFVSSIKSEWSLWQGVVRKCLHTCFKESGGQCIDVAFVEAGTQLDRHFYC